MRRLDVLIVTADFFPDTFGGVERCVFELARGLAERGYEVTVVARQARPELPTREQMHGFRVFRFRMAPRPLPVFQVTEAFGAWRVVRRVTQRRMPDIVHVHEALPGSVVSGWAARRKIPLVYTMHAPWGEEWRRAFAVRRPRFNRGLRRIVPEIFSGYLRAIERRSLSRAIRIVALSRYIRNILIQDYRVAAERIVRIPGGVDLQRFCPHPHRAGLRRSFEVGADSIVLLTVRRLVPRMGVDNLIRAMGLLKSEFPGLVLWLVGGGPMQTDLQRLAVAERVADRVKFLGMIPDDNLPPRYQAADLFVLPTAELEGFGLATLESLACGTPVLGTRAGATPEILEPLEPGLLTRDTSAAALAEGIRTALRQRLLDDEMRQRCRTYVLERYSWQRYVDQHEALYARCLEFGRQR